MRKPAQIAPGAVADARRNAMRQKHQPAMLRDHLAKLVDRLESLDGRIHRSLVWAGQISAFLLSGILAFAFRFDLRLPPDFGTYALYCLPIWVIVKTIVFRLQQLDRGWWRFVSVHDLGRLAAANLIASAAATILIHFLGPGGFPRSVYLLDFLNCFLATSGLRVGVRMLVEYASEARRNAVSIFIYGAGACGVMLSREIRSNPALPFTVCGFIDDNPQKRRASIQGLKVLGSGKELRGLAARYGVREILIAIPSAAGFEMTSILAHCQEAGIRCRTMPAIADLIRGRGLLGQIRDVGVEDLLGRTPVVLEEEEISNQLAGRAVMVTGAGGSIGSEICRQVARFRPRRIIAFDLSENALFHLEQEMKNSFPEVPFHPEVGSIQNRRRLDDVIENYHPGILYHAAAFKHVPLMENHIVEAVENNILGTYTVLTAAIEHGISDFVMISSDKAVRPSNVMGATKRVAELLTISVGAARTKAVAVRFGNVLGSNGSVIPLFKKQIASGGPITVTHPEMRRYFMTIPEAVQLVLQASTMGNGGEIFVLDMGQPVKIVDLARNLIALSGLRPDVDIRIEFTGVRAGEKLFEEITMESEATAPTRHEKIHVFLGAREDPRRLLGQIQELRRLCRDRDIPNLVLLIKEMAPEYNPSSHVLRTLVVSERRSRAIAV